MDRAQRPPEGFDQPANAAVLAYLANRACHSDTGEVLAKAARSNAIGVYCPEPARYSYVVAHVSGQIIAFAEGMQGFCAHLPEPIAAECLASGALPVAELPGWLFFPLFQPPYFERQIATLVQQAASTATA
jgi:hypothetical protein